MLYFWEFRRKFEAFIDVSLVFCGWDIGIWRVRKWSRTVGELLFWEIAKRGYSCWRWTKWSLYVHEMTFRSLWFVMKMGSKDILAFLICLTTSTCDVSWINQLSESTGSKTWNSHVRLMRSACVRTRCLRNATCYSAFLCCPELYHLLPNFILFLYFMNGACPDV